MRIDHIHFFVDDAAATSAWFQAHLGWNVLRSPQFSPCTVWNNPDLDTKYLTYRSLTFAISSPRRSDSWAGRYLRDYAPGVADVAVQVNSLDQFLSQRPTLRILEQHPGQTRVAGWGGLSHTLVEQPAVEQSPEQSPADALVPQPVSRPASPLSPTYPGLDHLVLNVPAGELQAAVQFYQHLFELELQQTFQIQTPQSGLHSQVLYSPQTQIYFNINEPASPSSQIQIFLEANRGAGIQHLALKAAPLIQAVAELRRRGLPLLPTATRYYERVRDRLQGLVPIAPEEWQQMIHQQILVDGNPEKPGSLLLQIFSKPIFDEPTFFLSLLSGGSRLRASARAIFWRCIRPWKQNWNGSRLTHFDSVPSFP